jgi:hypothetical protein
MKKSFAFCDIFFIVLAVAVCIASLKLGLGTFGRPHAGFVPFLAACILGFLALADLVTGLRGTWKRIYGDKNAWANIKWGKILLTSFSLFVYAMLFETLGFLTLTLLLLLLLFQMLEPKPWKKVVLAAALTTLVFYVVFKKGLEVQLPSGFWGF